MSTDVMSGAMRRTERRVAAEQDRSRDARLPSIQRRVIFLVARFLP